MAKARGRLVGPTLAAFAVVVVLVCGIFAFLLHAVGDLRDDAEQARRTERVVLLTTRLNRLVVDLETRVRGRLLTNDDRLLEPYRAAQQAIPSVRDELRGLV